MWLAWIKTSCSTQVELITWKEAYRLSRGITKCKQDRIRRGKIKVDLT